MAQMWNGQDTLYGNEWIDYDKEYLKISLAADGMYVLTGADLASAGFPLNTIQGDELRLYHSGKEIPIYVSNPGILGTNDRIEFPGQKNRASLDSFLFQSPKAEMLNPEYSLYNDTASYFLGWNISGPPPLRIETAENDFSNLPPPLNWCWEEKKQVLHSHHIEKRYDSQNLVAYSHFDVGEGFGSNYQKQQELLFELEGWWKNAPSASVSLRLFSDPSSSSGDHELRISIDGQSYYEATPAAYTLIQTDFELDPDDVKTNLAVLAEGLYDNNDRYSLAFGKVRYRRDLDFSGAPARQFEVEASPEKQYIELENPGDAPVLYDLTHHTRILPEILGGIARFTLPPSSENIRLMLLNEEEGYLKAANISAIAFEDLRSSSADYLLLSHAALFSDGQGNNRVEEYASYRRSLSGGGYDVQVVDIQQVYDQFAYGVDRHAISIRNFGHFVMKNWQKPQYFLLIGHGFAYPLIRQEGNGYLNRHFLPCFGNPGSDNLLLSYNNTETPGLPIGRIAAQTADEVKAYLEKVKEHEAGLISGQSIEKQQWRQRILHLVGGNPQEQGGFALFLNNLKNEIEANGYGGQVETLFKESNEPVQTSVSDVIIQAFKEGVGIKTFLGHGAVTNTDFGLDDPSLFDNKGRYPLVFSLGCLSGNIYDQQNSVSERFLLVPEKGSIAYIASSGFAFPNVLDALTRRFYTLLGSDYYDQGLGDIMREVRKTFEDNNSLAYRSLLQQFCYHGDPAVRLRAIARPDYTPDAGSLRFSPTLIDAQTDSFEVSFTVANIGFCSKDSFALRLQRKAGNTLLSERIVDVTASGPETAFRYTFPVMGEEGRGQNLFLLKVDAEDEVEEGPLPTAEFNNDLTGSNGQQGLPFYVLDNNAYPIFPAEFALIDNPRPSLKASTTDALASIKTYRFELDTSAYYNSPLKQATEVTQKGGVVSWTPGNPLKEGIVYYWRISVDKNQTANGEYNWQESSFIFFPDKGNGWNQSHFFQIRKNSLNQLSIEEPDRRLRFAQNSSSVIGEAMALTSKNNALSRILVNNHRIHRAPTWWGKNLNIAVFDPVSGANWTNPPGGEYGAYNLSNSDYNAFIFKMDSPEERKKVMDFLNDIVPEGYYVLFFTNHLEGNDFEPESWAADSLIYNQNLFQVLENNGAQLVRQLEDKGSVPYIFGYIKGEQVLGEKLSNDEDIPVSILFSLPGRWDQGSMQSAMIGPAASWEKLDWSMKPAPQPENDFYKISLWGLSADQSQEDLLLESTSPEEISLENISVSAYPWLKLQLDVLDTLDRSCPELDYWRVYYQGLGDAAVNPAKGFSFYKDSLQQGEELSLAVVVENTASPGLDSLLLRFSVQDLQTNEELEFFKRLPPLPGGDSLRAAFRMDSRNLQGPQRLVLEANPSLDQPENILFNNLLVQDFYVVEDEFDPFLEVTFDGRRIMNGDLVSSEPFILISLRDENPYLPLEDTTLLNLSLTYPGGQLRPLYFSDPEINFVPAQNDKVNRARVEFRPRLEQDGTYRLSVNGRDASGNLAGNINYQIDFEVINERMISNVLPYPNPFSTACRFVYTLTGDRTPDFFKIQIMTISGKIVREISGEEFGPLKVGTHQSEFIWDGTDDYGDKLANGVYLYRVIARNREEGELKRYADERVDRFFKQELGKIVILR
jgi:hypothetical protein